MSQAEQTYQAIIDKLRAKNRQQADRIAELENELELTRESYATSLQIIDQRADRIAELEKLVSEMKYEKSSGVYEKQSEPVAWMTENGTIFDELPPISGGLIPLYTTPQTKPLSDEELLQAIGRAWCSPDNSHKEMDSVLAIAIAEEIKTAIEANVRGES